MPFSTLRYIFQLLCSDKLGNGLDYLQNTCLGYTVKIYCIGGDVPNPDYIAPGTNSGLACDIVEVYDIVANSWSTKASLPIKGSFIQAGVIDGKIFVLNNTSLYMYDPITNVWTAKTSVPGTSIQPSSTVMAAVDDTLIAFQVERVMIYDTKNDAWREGKAYPTNVYGRVFT